MNRITLSALVLLCLGRAHATVPAGERNPHQLLDDFVTRREAPAREWPAPLGPFAYSREFDQIIRFLEFWQQDNPSLPHYGGMIEAEAGPLGNVIQTDNTLEAIWCWSRWRQLTGGEEMDNAIALAWEYCQNYPAWLEEGQTGDNYYRAHNCAWALGACDMYEEATADTSFRAYGRTCAQYIADHPLSLPANTTINAFVTGWCAGSLYEYAVRHGRDDLRTAALAEAERLFEWIMVNPETRLALNDWAMSSGTMLWGISVSLFAERPLLAMNWHFAHAMQIPEWAHWSNVPGYDWDSSWNVAYANGLFALSEAVGDPVMRERAMRITDGLLSWDVDDDGGIMADSHDPHTEDMSWVSCYLARFCLARLLPETLAAQDAGLLRLAGLVDEQDLEQQPGQPTASALIVYGNGQQQSLQAELFLDEVQLGSWNLSPAFAQLDTLLFALPADLPVGRHELLAGISSDDNVANDSLKLHIWVPRLSSLPGDGSAVRDLVSARYGPGAR